MACTTISHVIALCPISLRVVKASMFLMCKGSIQVAVNGDS